MFAGQRRCRDLRRRPRDLVPGMTHGDFGDRLFVDSGRDQPLWLLRWPARVRGYCAWWSTALLPSWSRVRSISSRSIPSCRLTGFPRTSLAALTGSLRAPIDAARISPRWRGPHSESSEKQAIFFWIYTGYPSENRILLRLFSLESRLYRSNSVCRRSVLSSTRTSSSARPWPWSVMSAKRRAAQRWSNS